MREKRQVHPVLKIADHSRASRRFYRDEDTFDPVIHAVAGFFRARKDPRAPVRLKDIEKEFSKRWIQSTVQNAIVIMLDSGDVELAWMKPRSGHHQAPAVRFVGE